VSIQKFTEFLETYLISGS